MKAILNIFVPTPPRKRAENKITAHPRKTGGMQVRPCSTKEDREYRRFIQRHVQMAIEETILPSDSLPIDGPVYVQIEYFFNTREMSRPAFRDRRPTLGSLDDAVLAALDGIVWTHGCKVVERRSRKVDVTSGTGIAIKVIDISERNPAEWVN